MQKKSIFALPKLIPDLRHYSRVHSGRSAPYQECPCQLLAGKEREYLLACLYTTTVVFFILNNTFALLGQVFQYQENYSKNCNTHKVVSPAKTEPDSRENPLPSVRL